jgi:hypothetical protein
MTDGSSAGALRFGLLGPVRAFRGAEAVDLGPVRQQAVLAVLLLNAGKPVPAQQIVAALWNGDPPENGIDVVQRCIGGLRRALEPSLLAFTDAGYVLRVDPDSVDTGMFRAALAQAHTDYRTGDVNSATAQVRGALDLWEDEPLAGLTGAFFQSARERLNSERTSASQLLAVPAAAPAPAPGTRPTAPPPAAPPPAARPPAPLSATRPMHSSVNPPTTLPATRPMSPPPARPGSTTAPHRQVPLDATRIDSEAADSAYPEPVDPWGDHDLFPPDPTAMG